MDRWLDGHKSAQSGWSEEDITVLFHTDSLLWFYESASCPHLQAFEVPVFVDVQKRLLFSRKISGAVVEVGLISCYCVGFDLSFASLSFWLFKLFSQPLEFTILCLRWFCCFYQHGCHGNVDHVLLVMGFWNKPSSLLYESVKMIHTSSYESD